MQCTERILPADLHTCGIVAMCKFEYDIFQLTRYRVEALPTLEAIARRSVKAL